MKVIIPFLLTIILIGCGKSNTAKKSVVSISEDGKQKSIFQSLIAVTNYTIPENIQNDSLAFLILPVHASCPSCRKKTIDNIVKHQRSLPNRHFIIISANGGRKTVNGYFKEKGAELPLIKNRLFLDSINRAYEFKLYEENPVMYYTYNGKAYKKVASIPATIRKDLYHFFSGKDNLQ